MALNLPPIPPVLKPIQHYMKIAAEHETRDPVVAYWSRIYSLQSGLKIDRKSKESLMFLTSLMDWLEKRKKELNANEAITNEVVAQAHIEECGLKLFMWADSEDRAGRFNKNVVKAFYSAGMIFDILATFGETSEEIVHHTKYAKWKAAYIHNCLKNGEMPISGPVGGEDDEFGASENVGPSMPQDPFSEPGGAASNQHPTFDNFNNPSSSSYFPQGGLQPPMGGAHAPPSTPSDQTTSPTSSVPPFTQYEEEYKPPACPGGISLTAEDYTRAQKYCKWAGSALQYEDAKSAIENLQKALKLLTTGQDT